MEKEPTLTKYSNGGKYWRVDGYLHRIDGPAVIFEDGAKEWWQHGKRHRIDGPAVEYDGGKSWWVNGKLYSFEEWKEEVGKYYETNEDYLLMLLKLD